jgi:asparagine synthase (glutamine-hydrolysing)
MCGITGWIDWETDLTRQRDVLATMIETLSSRGPDASGAWVSTHAALGHRRLIVVDPEGGGQPMTRQRGEHTYIITYNGELYNTLELRQELESRGHTFFTRNSDTEALLLAYVEWGPACLQYFNGIFAFAIWDDHEQSLFLARDRLGVKPLFYTQRGSVFLFASEPKSLLANPLLRAEVDEEGLAEVFALGPARTPGHGVYRGISEVKPGYYLIYRRNGLQLHRYWTLESRPHEENLEDTSGTISQLLKDTVERQLVADVPVCVLLSGGLDSSALAAFAAGDFKEAGMSPLHTYSIDYRDNESHFQTSHYQPDYDAPWVEYMSGFLGTVHHKIIIDIPDLTEALEKAVTARDLPGMADVDSSLYLFCREIKKEATVALSGEAADEVFGGYPWFHSETALNLGTFPWMRAVQERLRLLSPELIQYIRPEEYILTRYQETLKDFPRLPGESPLEARRREMFYLNIIWFMTTLLDRKDRMSMANGLEVRVPYCDHRLVEYVWNIPWEMKTCGNQAKGILRRALSGVLPEKVLARRKNPYPKTYHPAYLAAVKNRLLEILDDPGSPLLPLIDVGAVRAMALSEERTFNYPWFGQLMGDAQYFAYLIEADAWLRKYHVAIV